MPVGISAVWQQAVRRSCTADQMMVGNEMRKIKRCQLWLMVVLLGMSAAGMTARAEAESTGKGQLLNSRETAVQAPAAFSFSGGTGKVEITCPEVYVTEENVTAKIVFSSPYYDYVRVGDEKYETVIEDETAAAVIPVELDENTVIYADTTRMSEPHEIEYTLFVSISGSGWSLEEEYIPENAQYFRIFRTDVGLKVLEIDRCAGDAETDAAAGSAANTDSDAAAGAVANTDSDAAAGAAGNEESDEMPGMVMNARQEESGVFRILLVPEGNEVPAGMENEMTVIHVPVDPERTCIASASAAALLDKNAEDPMNLDFKGLLLDKCELVILPSTMLEPENEEVFNKTEESLKQLGIPFLIDRSGDESSEEAREEWSMLFNAIFSLTVDE